MSKKTTQPKSKQKSAKPALERGPVMNGAEILVACLEQERSGHDFLPITG